jgi:DNA-binding CsgD family transcriptional regulator
VSRVLTTRQHEVLALLVQGKSNSEIAQALDMAENTVKVHLRNIYEKLGVDDRTGAVTRALERGILHLDEDGPRPLERYPGHQAYLSSDPVGLPWEDDTFDAVLSCGVLEHVGQPERSLDELRRVLRPKGTLYVYKLPNRASYLEWIARRAGLYYHGAYPDDRLYDLEDAQALIARHGFDVLEARRSNMLPLTLPGRVAAALTGPIWAANRLLARIPLLNRLATNVEVVAVASPGP